MTIQKTGESQAVKDPQALSRPVQQSFASFLRQSQAERKPASPSPGPETCKTEIRGDILCAVDDSAKRHQLPSALVLAVIKQESGFNPQARSSCGAQGLMQLMPETADAVGVKNPYDVRQNVEGGCRYLRQMLDRFDGNVPSAVAAYNAGPSAVEKYNGVPPYAETQNYVPSVLAHYEKFNGAPITSGGLSSDSMESLAATAVATEALASAVVASSVTHLKLPERQKVEEPPPPPPRGVRV